MSWITYEIVRTMVALFDWTLGHWPEPQVTKDPASLLTLQ